MNPLFFSILHLCASESLMQFTKDTRMTILQMAFHEMMIINVPIIMH
jgi:hypothetical protein